VADHPVDPEELQRVGLYDPDDEHAAERLDLISYLTGLGATVEDLRRAGEGELPGVAAMLAIRGRPTLTMAEVASRAGVTEELARRVYRAAGFPDADRDALVGNEEDVDVLRTLRGGMELLGREEMIQLTRVVGSALARVADAMVSAFIVNVVAPSLDEDPAGLALARANAEAGALLRASGAGIDMLLRRHIDLAQRPLVMGVQETQALAVGFVDLVGSTALAQRLSMSELGALLTSFDELASEAILGGGGRFVKLIGDEVMFVAADPAAACGIALEIVEGLHAHRDLPDGRGGLASGEVLTRDGDYFGPVVNLAARSVKLAGPGATLASRALAETCAADYQFTPIGAQDLAGFEEPVELFRLERAP
jgi:class 3 adenylate cyclase